MLWQSNQLWLWKLLDSVQCNTGSRPRAKRFTCQHFFPLFANNSYVREDGQDHERRTGLLHIQNIRVLWKLRLKLYVQESEKKTSAWEQRFGLQYSVTKRSTKAFLIVNLRVGFINISFAIRHQIEFPIDVVEGDGCHFYTRNDN